MPVTMEVCIDSLDAAQTVADVLAGTDYRIELCSNLISGGGLTPSMGLYMACATVIPPERIMVMIRPRLGTFTYTPTELLAMLSDISAFRALPNPPRGFVFGALLPSGCPDPESTAQLVSAAVPHEVTFHRAFDLVPHVQGAYTDLAKIKGITRILSSGGATTALEGNANLRGLFFTSLVHAGPRILPGSGINSTTVRPLLEALPFIREVHLSAGSFVRPDQGEVEGGHPDVGKLGSELGFGEEGVWTLDRRKLEEVRDLVGQWNDERPE